jgi:hypothetical protein
MSKLYKRLTLTILVLTSILTASAQDNHYSWCNMAPGTHCYIMPA